MAVVYFTSNASTGAGSLAEAIQNAQPGDVVRPDETVFERGATIEIALASQLNVNKDLTLDASPFRISLNGGGAVRCLYIAEGATVRVAGFDFMSGSTTSSGGGIYVADATEATFERCAILGCLGKYGGGAYAVGTAKFYDCLIAGCKATIGGGLSSIGATTVNGSTVAGCVASEGAACVRVSSGSFTATNSIFVGVVAASVSPVYSSCVVGVASSSVGFVAPPPDDLAPETWTPNAWRDWDLRLLDDASPNPSPYRDAGDVDNISRHDAQGNFRGRVTGGAASCSPGAYETLQADLFWVGVDSNGATVATPSFLSADGWATSRFATASGDAAPQAGQSVFVDGRVHFIDALSTTSTQTFGLTVGGRATVSTGSDATTQLDLSLGLGATFGVSASATLRRFGADAKFDWTSGDLTVAVDVASSSLTIPPGSTLTVAGVRVAVETLRIGDAASVAFSPVRSQDAADGTATTHADAILTADQNATVGAASFSGTGYFATPQGTDASAATFETSVRRVDFCAEVKAFAATATGPTTAKLAWSATDAAARVCVERENAAAPNGWEVVAITPTKDALPLEVALSGKERFRIFDGQTFRVDSAWFPTDKFYRYAATVVAVRNVRNDWKIRVKVVMPGSVCYRNEGARFLAQILDGAGTPLAPGDVASITATVYRIGDYLGRTWTSVDGWNAVEVPQTSLLETPTADADWPSNGDDDPGPNFVWTPDVAAKPIFPESGDYATQVKLTLVGGGAVVVTFETSVK